MIIPAVSEIIPTSPIYKNKPLLEKWYKVRVQWAVCILDVPSVIYCLHCTFEWLLT